MLYLECYPLDSKLKPLSFFVYKAEVIEPRGAVLKSVLNSAVRRLNHSTGYGAGYFACADENFVYTRKEVAPEHLSCDYRGAGKTYIYRLLPQGEKLLPFAHADIYAAYFKQRVTLKLLSKRFMNKRTKKEEAFYFLRDGHLLSKFLLDPQKGIWVEKISPENIQLLRQYDFQFDIRTDGSGYLCLNTRSQYESTETLYDMIKKNTGRTESVLQMKVKYDCPLSGPMWGTIVPQSESTDKDFSKSTTAYLFDYFRKKYGSTRRTEAFLATIPQDDYVVFMRKNNTDTAFAVLSSLLRPSMTQEYVAGRDAGFLKSIGILTKRKMNVRLQLDGHFLKDIGVLPDSDGVKVSPYPTKAIDLGYQEKRLTPPELVIGGGRVISCEPKAKNAIFGPSGYFSPAPILDNHLRIGLVCTDTFDADTFIRKLGPYLKMPKAYKPVVFHDFGTKKDLTSSLMEIRDRNFDVLIVAMPDDGFVGYNLYNEMKNCLAELGIPSQMLNLHTAKRIIDGDPYSAMNIVMGCLGKLGGIPYVIREMPGNVDLFVGLDVGTLRTGTHYPGCSVCLDAHGGVMGCYQPLLPQPGEKINEQTLEKIFNTILLKFEEKNHRCVRSMVIHRDGFSNENLEWYDRYFHQNNIDYTLVEVRKSGALRLADNRIQGNNPNIGSVLYRGDSEAILVTTSPIGKMGAPAPIHLFKVAGALDIETITKQIYYLTKIHVGAKQNTRLPITTKYADLICKNLEYMPKNQFLYKLYFL